MERYEYFKLFHDISTEDYNLMADKLKTKTFRKGEFITVVGQVQKELYFVKSGVQMSYFDAGDKTEVPVSVAARSSRKCCCIAAHLRV